jgi:hypothetical protein
VCEIIPASPWASAQNGEVRPPEYDLKGLPMKTTLMLALASLSLCATALAQSRSHRLTGNNVAFQQIAEVMGTQLGSAFGDAVAISGNTMVIGASVAAVGCGQPPDGCGAAYVFLKTGDDWSNPALVATLTQTDGITYGGFGSSVAISGNTIVVSGYGNGAAFVFVEPAGGWTDMTQTAELTVSGGLVAEPPVVAIDGDTIVAGYALDTNSAYVYVKPEGGWVDMTQSAQLVGTDVQDAAWFGRSVAVSGRHIVVGARQNRIDGVKQGSAYLFTEPASGWNGVLAQTTEFTGSDSTRNGLFGESISLSDDTVAVGAPYQQIGSTQGAVYVYVRPSTGWPQKMTQTAKLSASKGGGGAQLGISVAVAGGIVLTGAIGVQDYQGVGWIFREPPGGWTNATTGEEIQASDGAPNDIFGYAVAIGDGVLVVGAYEDTLSDQGDGAAYIFAESN